MRLSVFHSEDPDIPDFSSASENIRILNPDIENILNVRMYLFLKPKSNDERGMKSKQLVGVTQVLITSNISNTFEKGCQRLKADGCSLR